MKPGPWGCVIRSGAMSSRSGAPAATSKLPLSGGIGTTPWSSTRSTSSVFRSSSTITPSTGCAHSLSPGAGLRKATARHSRWPVSSSGPKWPAGQASTCTVPMSVTPRRAIAAWNSGSSSTARSASTSSETTAIGWMSVRRTQRVTSPEPTATVASTVSRADRSRITTSASRAGSGPPCSHSSSARLSGSSRAIVTKRLSSPRLCVRQAPATASISPASSGSSGCVSDALLYSPHTVS